MTVQQLFEKARGQDVLFITTKELDYLRNTQEIALLRRTARTVTVVGSNGRGYLRRLLKVYARLLTSPLKRYGFVFVGFAPQLVIPLFRRRFRGFVAVDFFISMYDTLVCDRRRFHEGSLPARLLERFDRKTLGGCDAVVADTRADAAYFSERLGADPARTAVLYLEADRSIYHPMPVRKPAGGPRWRVLYFGSILPLQGVDVILRAAQRLAKEPDIGLDLIGPLPGPLRTALEALPNVRLTRWLPQPELARRIAAADLCLAGHFSAQIDKAARTIPGKAFLFEAMEKPMILGDGPANRERFRPDARHIFVPRGDPDALSGAIRAFCRPGGEKGACGR